MVRYVLSNEYSILSIMCGDVLCTRVGVEVLQLTALHQLCYCSLPTAWIPHHRRLCQQVASIDSGARLTKYFTIYHTIVVSLS